MVIAIDGFSSCGKSTIAKALAKKLNLPYIDSGAMYRAVTWYFINNDINLNNDSEVYGALNSIHLKFVRDGESNVLYCNGQPLLDEIRTMEVSNLVSEVSAISDVRVKLVTLQQDMGEHGAVMDGRDIGTVVFPKADYKFFIIADANIRAQRRFDELTAKNENVTFEEVLENLTHRDQIDTTREHSPLVKAEDAVEINNSYMTKEEQLDLILEYITERLRN